MSLVMQRAQYLTKLGVMANNRCEIVCYGGFNPKYYKLKLSNGESIISYDEDDEVVFGDTKVTDFDAKLERYHDYVKQRYDHFLAGTKHFDDFEEV